MSGRAIKDSIQQLAGTFNKDIVSIVACTVDSVDQDNRTCDCTPISGDAITDIPGVQLMAEVNDGILILPSVGSTVIVGLSTRNTAFVIMYSSVDTITLRGGQYGGLTKTQELKTQIDKTNEVVNAILNILTGSPINEPGNGAPSALQAALSAALAGKMVGDFSNIENTKIKHG